MGVRFQRLREPPSDAADPAADGSHRDRCFFGESDVEELTERGVVVEDQLSSLATARRHLPDVLDRTL